MPEARKSITEYKAFWPSLGLLGLIGVTGGVIVEEAIRRHLKNRPNPLFVEYPELFIESIEKFFEVDDPVRIFQEK